ncbi:MAG: winged helix-turn-helix transcriptional regulator [Parvibaculaceae bacterium]
MHPKKAFGVECPVARSLECIGEWWSLLILRDAFQGLTRFDEFQKSLGIAPNILSRRLAHLTEAGLFERRRYSERPPRHDYVLTGKGRDLFPVVMAIFAWGNKHLAPKGETVLIASRRTARRLDPIIVDAGSKTPITLDDAYVIPGPRATSGTHERLAMIQAKRLASAPAKG